MLTEEIREQLAAVSTATLTHQLQIRGVRSTFLSGLRPTHPELRMIGQRPHAALRRLREDVKSLALNGRTAQKQVVETVQPGDVVVIEVRGVPDAGTMATCRHPRQGPRRRWRHHRRGPARHPRDPGDRCPSTTRARTPRRTAGSTCPTASTTRSRVPGCSSNRATSSSATPKVRSSSPHARRRGRGPRRCARRRSRSSPSNTYRGRRVHRRRVPAQHGAPTGVRAVAGGSPWLSADQSTSTGSAIFTAIPVASRIGPP